MAVSDANKRCHTCIVSTPKRQFADIYLQVRRVNNPIASANATCAAFKHLLCGAKREIAGSGKRLSIASPADLLEKGQVMHYEISIMAFNRPEYLALTCQSIKKSLGSASESPTIHLFQDGWFNYKSKTAKASREIIETNVDVFLETFSDGVVHTQEENLGVAMNFHRAEQLMFDERQVDAAIFFEDDLVLDERYIGVLINMLKFYSHDPRVGILACYGSNHAASHDTQIEKNGSFSCLHHNWGFGLSRLAYQRTRSMVDDYIDIIRDCDYAQKDRLQPQIHALQRRLGFPRHILSQDMFKTMAHNACGSVNINTNVVLAKYIGKVGLHSNEEHYAAMGYEDTQLFPFEREILIPETISENMYFELKSEQEKYIHATAEFLGIDQN